MLYAGLMSGTSLDGVDGVLADLSQGVRCVAHRHRPFDPELRAELLALNRPGGADELHRAALAANGVALTYAAVLRGLCEAAGVAPSALRAVGAHGQTVRHRPEGRGYTLQLLNAARLAEEGGVDVVADLRSRDVAAGGQGAPLVPAFHAAVFARPGVDVAVLNLGGIANLTLLPAAGGPVRGFDTGPGNVLLDHWVQCHRGQPFDADGAWAAGGRVLPGLLRAMRAEPYFALPPPKSTGRDLFGPDWLETRLPAGAAAQDVQATLLALTAETVADALRREQPATRVLRVCGGGARNGALMAALAARLPGVDLADTGVEGVAPEQVEALAFAWLAQAFVERRPGNLPAVTGAAGPRVLGALYPA
ncbi:MAG: anhydro-N-acetylmuramic acid kinase [Rubrivivax sp.]